MADAYEPYHVLQQQQNRRDHKLDTHFHFHPPPPSSSSGAGTALFPLADSDFLAAGGFHSNHHNNNHNQNPSYSNFMGFLGGPSSSSSEAITVAGVTTTGDHHSFTNTGLSSGDVLVFKPEPLSLSLSSSSHPRLTSYDLIVPTGGEFCRSAAAAVTVASRSVAGPLGPFTGYASILKGSRFLKPAQMLLDEFCNVGRGIYNDDNDGDDSSLLFHPSVENLCGVSDVGAVGEIGKKKSKLISMLDEVYKRYKQYFEQLQAVMGSFECVAGLGHAAPFATLALKALSKHFKFLKNAITEQLQFSNKLQQQCGTTTTTHVMSSENNKNESLRFGGSHDGSRGFGSRHGFADNHAPVWRPHRGLPERAVTVLRAWLFDHFLHPYPTDTDKLMLAKQTGLSRNQVSNWFINARVRVWKPMVEEIHMLETRQSQRSSSSSWRDERSTNTNIFPENNNPSSSSVATQQQQQQQRANNTSPTRRARNDNVNNNNFVNAGNGGGGNGGVSFSYGIGSSNVPNGVSLTLGLHHQIGLPESNFPMTTAQRFGLDSGGNSGGGGGGGGGGYEGQNREFGRDFIGGSNHQFLHDFVG